MSISETTIFKFSKSSSTDQWQIVNDDVMGGKSESSIDITEKGYGKFSGHVSLANNGGFASMRLLRDVEVKPNQNQIVLRLKGDGKTYQFRLKGNQNQRQSYVQEFQTNRNWQTVKLSIDEFSPQFRGRKLEMPNFNFSKIEEIRFLIANKKEQNFELLIDSIVLK